MKPIYKAVLAASLLSFIISCQSEQTKTEQKTVTAAQTDTKPSNNSWIGEWRRSEWNNSAGIDIKSVRGDTLEFELWAGNGGHMGNLDGFALIKGNKATYALKEDFDDCLIEFEIFGDTVVTIDQVKGNCFAAMGVYYSGTFYNTKYKAFNENEGKDEFTVLENAGEEALLRKLTGKDYELFVNSTQLTTEDVDVDSLNCRVYMSGIRGLFTQMENIVMVNSNKEMWAAVIDDQKVYYYTNRPDYVDRLPKTIDNWRKNFIEYPVAYKEAE
jgi:hypothetical protein